MKHTLQIRVSKKPDSGGIIRCRHVSARERLLRLLLGEGEKRSLAIIVPGDSVDEVAIKEVADSDDESE